MMRKLALLAFVTTCLVFSATIAHAEDDATIPGVMRTLPATIEDSLSIPDDVDDVSTVYIPKGKTFMAYLESDVEGFNVRMALFPPDSESVADLSTAVSVSTSPLGLSYGPQFMMYTSRSGGFYYLDTYVASGSTSGGAYGVSAQILPSFAVTKPTVPSKIARGKWFTAKSNLKVAWEFPGASAYFTLQTRSGGKWKTKWAKMNAWTKIVDEPGEDKDQTRFWVKVRLNPGRYRIRAVFNDGWGKKRYSPYREFRVR